MEREDYQKKKRKEILFIYFKVSFYQITNISVFLYDIERSFNQNNVRMFPKNNKKIIPKL